MGQVFQVGEQKIRPGVFVRVTNIGEPREAIVPQGTVAVLFRASWGALATPITLESAEALGEAFGYAGTTDAITEAFRGGCRRVIAYRVGTGGTAATHVLRDTTVSPINVVNIAARNVGVRGNDLRLTIRDSLADTGQRELLVHEGASLVQTISFTKGAGEPQALVTAINASGSLFIAATLMVAGNGILAAVAQQPMTGGVDPVVTGASYSAGLLAVEPIDWNVLAIDATDAPTHALVQAYIGRVRAEGKRVMAVIGEPISVLLATRMANARSFNDPAIVYVANGLIGTDGATRDGYRAAARVAGMIAGAQTTDSLTHAIVRNAANIAGALTNAEIEQSILAGALVFTFSAQRQPQVEYGINTFISATATMDIGWSKIRRVRTRDNLMTRISATWDTLIGKINNSPDGRATLISSAQGIINRMVAEGALLQGIIYEDANNPPVGDSAWFVVQVDDLDSVEKVYINFAFRFAPPAQTN